MKIIDIMLLNEGFYRKLSDKRTSLNIGIILLGIVNMAIPIMENFTHLFMNKSATVLFYNITLALLYTVLAGFVYVLFFCFPLFDLFKYFKREKNLELSGFLTRFMKIYIIANFLILPANIILYVATYRINYPAATDFAYTSYFIMLLIMVWFTAAVARGLDAICGFNPAFKKIVFILIFVWDYLLQYVLGYIIANWAMLLFK
jgi:hypothetical protein